MGLLPLYNSRVQQGGVLGRLEGSLWAKGPGKGEGKPNMHVEIARTVSRRLHLLLSSYQSDSVVTKASLRR